MHRYDFVPKAGQAPWLQLCTQYIVYLERKSNSKFPQKKCQSSSLDYTSWHSFKSFFYSQMNTLYLLSFLMTSTAQCIREKSAVESWFSLSFLFHTVNDVRRNLYLVEICLTVGKRAKVMPDTTVETTNLVYGSSPGVYLGAPAPEADCLPMGLHFFIKKLVSYFLSSLKQIFFTIYNISLVLDVLAVPQTSSSIIHSFN